MQLVIYRGSTMVSKKRKYNLPVKWKARNAWLGYIRRACNQLTFFIFFESVFQLKLQASMLSAEKAVTGRIDKLTIFSEALGLIMAMYNFCKFFILIYTFISDLQPYVKSSDRLDMHLMSSALTDDMPSSLRRVKCRTAVTCALFIALYGYTWWQLVNVVFFCPCGGWNSG